jgi:hypothetical protein
MPLVTVIAPLDTCRNTPFNTGRLDLSLLTRYRGQFPDPGPWKIPPSQPVQLLSQLGIEDLPRQIFNKTKKQPFVLNIMIVGTSLSKWSTW